jgi:hypothetical protein
MFTLKHQPFAVKIFTLQLQFGERSSPLLSPPVARENFNQFKITLPYGISFLCSICQEENQRLKLKGISTVVVKI